MTSPQISVKLLPELFFRPIHQSKRSNSMTFEQAREEYAKMVHNACCAFGRALRAERREDAANADAAWLAGIKWNMNAQRENLQEALALRA